MDEEDTDSQQTNLLEGCYANSFQVGYNAFEFVLDFGQVFPGDDEGRFHSRIITAPAYAKRLLQVLQESIEQYERTFGIIPKEDE